jgi:hypothetical protein
MKFLKPLPILLALSLALAGCAPRAVRPAPALPEPAALLKSLEENGRRVQRFAAQGRWSYEGPRGNQNASFSLAAAPPDRLRLLAVDPFGRPALTVVARAGTIRLLSHKETRLYVGPTDLCLKKCFLPLGLSLAELMGLLAGGCPVWPFQEAQVSPDPAGRITLALLGSRACTGQDCREEILLDAEQRLPRQVRLLAADGRVLREVVFADYRDAGGFEAPYEISFTDETEQVSLKVSYDEVRINLPLSETLFSLEVPPGVSVQEVCRDANDGCR